MEQIDMTVDFLVIGSGAGAIGALRASTLGKTALVVEKTNLFGGSTSMSGGVIWAPQNKLMRAEGIHDSRKEVLEYFDTLIGDAGFASSPARRNAYIDGVLKMLDFLENEGVHFKRCPGMADYFSGMRGIRGGSKEGRSIEPLKFNRKKLGKEWFKNVRPGFSPDLNIYTGEAADLSAMRTGAGIRTLFRVIGRTIAGHLSGQKVVTNGEALMSAVLYALLKHKVPVWLNSSVTELILDGDKVIGAVIAKEGKLVRVHAKGGVLIASGGFSRNLKMRKEFAGHIGEMSDKWTSANPGDTGEVLGMAMKLGAATDMLDEAWWMPTWFLNDVPQMCLSERCKPHSIIVDAKGERFMDESISYQEAGHQMYKRQRDVGGALPCWLIFDTYHRNHYAFLMAPPFATPKAWLESGAFKKATTLEELAKKCGIDSKGLNKTVQRFNTFAKDGTDPDFYRGEGHFGLFYGDQSHKPNAALGPVDQPPYYAVALYPGDIGTSGGLLCDENGQVLRPDGTTISGLYATGNATASVMGRAYPGAGATIGASAIFAYLAAEHISLNKNKSAC
jgi:3-oxosteroid 1-dehydrogenase